MARSFAPGGVNSKTLERTGEETQAVKGGDDEERFRKYKYNDRTDGSKDLIQAVRSYIGDDLQPGGMNVTLKTAADRIEDLEKELRKGKKND